MELVVEVTNRSSRLHDKKIVEGGSITIGRAFDNSIILNDPHICAHHAKIEIDDSGSLNICDLNSVNGISDLRHKKMPASSLLKSGDGFILGKTHIRIYKKNHPIEPTVRLTSFEKILNTLGKPSICAGLVAFVFAISMLSIYMNTAYEIKWAGRVLFVVFVELLAILWAIIWSIIARIKKHDMRLMTQVSIVMLFTVSMLLLNVLFNWVGFHVGGKIYVEIINQIIIAILLFTLIWLNLYLSVFQVSMKRLGPAVALALLFFGLKYMVFDLQSEDFKVFASDFNGTLFPPSVTVYSTIDKDTFVNEASYIFESSSSSTD